MKETLKVNELSYYRGYGYYEEEHSLLTHFTVSISFERDFQDSSDQTTIADLINYEDVKQAVDLVFQKQWRFIEEISTSIFRSLSYQFSSCKISVSVTKHQPPMLNCQSTNHQVSNL